MDSQTSQTFTLAEYPDIKTFKADVHSNNLKVSISRINNYDNMATASESTINFRYTVGQSSV